MLSATANHTTTGQHNTTQHNTTQHNMTQRKNERTSGETWRELKHNTTQHTIQREKRQTNLQCLSLHLQLLKYIDWSSAGLFIIRVIAITLADQVWIHCLDVLKQKWESDRLLGELIETKSHRQCNEYGKILNT
jgi:hypothetical protein